jgi:nucleotide sugar dehydrogenase
MQMQPTTDSAKIVVVGGGKMGLPLACAFAHRGATVTVCDINQRIVDNINEGIDPHNEPEQDQYVREGAASGHLRASTETTREVSTADAVVILVSAMLTPEKDIDWGNLVSASAAVAKGLRRDALVSYETTLPIGGCRGTLAPILETSGLRAGSDFKLVFSPERVKSRTVFQQLAVTPKIVGGVDPASAEAGSAFYARWLGAPVTNVGTLEAAEFVKLCGMLYRDVNIALANELGAIAEETGLDVWPLFEAANTDSETFLLRPGIGVGGHCTPVYPYFLINVAARLGVPLNLAKLGRKLNEDQPRRQLERLGRVLGGLQGKRVHILGLAFRPEVLEDAYSPAVPLQDLLRAAGATVTIEDPLYSDSELRKKGFVPGAVQANAVDAVVLNTAHAKFRVPDFVAWRAAGVQAVLDGRGVWPKHTVMESGLAYIGVGIAYSPGRSKAVAPDADAPKQVAQFDKV